MNSRRELPCIGLSVRQRGLLAIGGTVLIALLIVAACLRPSDRGLGTHQQLGLPPCTLRWMFGMRCPSCGMTTSWAWMMRGNVINAVRVNAGGTLLAVAAMAAAPWMLASAARGTWIVQPPSDAMIAAAAVAVVVVVLVDWSIRLGGG